MINKDTVLIIILIAIASLWLSKSSSKELFKGDQDFLHLPKTLLYS